MTGIKLKIVEDEKMIILPYGIQRRWHIYNTIFVRDFSTRHDDKIGIKNTTYNLTENSAIIVLKMYTRTVNSAQKKKKPTRRRAIDRV